MAIPKFLAVGLLTMAVMSSVSASSSEANIDIQAFIQEKLDELLGEYESLHIPAAPPLLVNTEDDRVSMALSLADITLVDISNVKVLPLQITGLRPPTVKIPIVLPKVALDIGFYSSGGHLLNLPFNGEGSLMLAVHNLKIDVYVAHPLLNDAAACLESYDTILDNITISLDLDLRRLEVEFTNMNPGTDQGQLINIVLSSFGIDIIEYLELLLNDKFKHVADDIFIDLYMSATCPDWISNNPLNDKERMTQDLNDIFQHYLEVLKLPGRNI